MIMRGLIAILMALAALSASAQHYQSDFPPDEFRDRWTGLFDRIGGQAVAIVQGSPSTRGFEFPRQFNSFYYLSGIETPHAYLWLDGRTREVTLFLPPQNARLERSEGKVLSATDVELVKSLTGVDEVRSTDDMLGDWLGEALGQQPPALYTPFRPAEGYAQSRYEIERADTKIVNDYWDGRLPREVHLISLLKTRAPKPYGKPELELLDLSPVLDELRTIKSEREIALIRRASEIAGFGMMEAIRSTVPGAYEYQLDAAARYVYLLNGARLDGYRSITASGTENIANWHYFRNTRELQAGDLVLMDYAPDYHYYVSDIGRVWPVNGTFSATQRELVEVILRYRNELLARIRPGVTPAKILAEAAQAMEAWFDANPFSSERYEAAARDMIENGRGAFSHLVGMAVHDVGSYVDAPLLPGTVFSVDPTLRVPEENLYLRYEDTVVVTDTGVENFTDFLPSELDDIEALMQEEGVLQKVPAVDKWP
jgi:Xaa-Pro aminopeptidase